MNNKIRLGLIFGGKSSEHEISLASARSVLGALNREKYEPTLIGITKEGRWLIGGNPLKQLIRLTNSPLLRAANGGSEIESNDRAMVLQETDPLTTGGALRASVDVCFPLVHGPYGEDGTLQGFLELADIPYVGSGVAASAVGMDKVLMKSVFRAASLPIVDYLMVLRSSWENNPEETIREIEKALGYPCFVKPANLGSSVGVTKANNWDELTQGLTTAALFDRKILIERAVDAREIECSVLGNDQPLASLPGEIIPQREFYDYEAKYVDEHTRLIVPAGLMPDQTRAVQDFAVRAFKALDCAGMARVDFFVDRQDGRVLLNEINTIPGFTNVSMYPRMWEASGLTYPELIDRLIELARERHADKQRAHKKVQMDGD